MKVMITGHRPNKLNNDYDLTSELSDKIRQKILLELGNLLVKSKSGIEEGIGGMALGIDTIFAELCIQIKIPFAAYIPCRYQHKMWPQKSKDRYSKILKKASRIVLVSDCEYNSSVMQKRNEAMVDDIGDDGVVIAVWDGSRGGTANCIDYAKSKNKTIIQINPKQL